MTTRGWCMHVEAWVSGQCYVGNNNASYYDDASSVYYLLMTNNKIATNMMRDDEWTRRTSLAPNFI